MPRSRLQEEIGKRHPFDLPEQEAALNVARTADFLHQPFEKLFESHGLSGPQYNLLRILRGHGDAGVPCHAIGEQMVTLLAAAVHVPEPRPELRLRHGQLRLHRL